MGMEWKLMIGGLRAIKGLGMYCRLPFFFQGGRGGGGLRSFGCKDLGV